MQRNRASTIGTALTLAGFMALATGGCGLNENGRAASLDQFTYHSTAYQPKTITVLDTRDQQEIITIEVPVGKKLSTRYYRDQSGNEYRPDVMRWSIHNIGHISASLDNEIAVPRGDGGRMVIMTIRDAPELAPGTGPAPLAPVAETGDPELAPLPASEGTPAPLGTTVPRPEAPTPAAEAPSSPPTATVDPTEPAEVPAIELPDDPAPEPEAPAQEPAIELPL